MHRRIGKIFDWEANHKSHAMTLSENFERGRFLGERYRRMEDKKLRPSLAFNEVFAKQRGLEPKVKKRNCLTCVVKKCNLNLSQMGVWGGASRRRKLSGPGGKAPIYWTVYL